MATALKTNGFIEIIKGRRSIRTYDPTVKINKEEMILTLEEETTAPSSVNAQPWRFLSLKAKKAKKGFSSCQIQSNKS